MVTQLLTTWQLVLETMVTKGATVPVGDAERGKKIFIQRCAECHTIEQGDPHKIGPNLHGLLGRKTGQAPGYNYTAANRERNLLWTPESLFTYLEKPRRVIPGTKMAFNGLRDVQQRADVVAYIQSKCK